MGKYLTIDNTGVIDIVGTALGGFQAFSVIYQQ